MQNKESISVVIPTYNRGKDLMRAIDSVLKQTYPVMEILVCDDGSTDNTKELVFALKNPIVKWVDCGKNGGPAIPRNTGIKQSNGSWIAFLDSDDSWIDTKLEKQMNVIRQYNSKAVSTNANRIIQGENKGAYLIDTKKSISLIDLMYVNSIICSSVLINKNLLLQTSLFPEEKKLIAIEDYALWLRVTKLSHFTYIDEALVNYCDSPNTSIRTNYDDSYDIFEIVFSNFKAWLNKESISLSYNEKKEFKMLQKRIKNKGIPTKWDLLVRKIKSKFR